MKAEDLRIGVRYRQKVNSKAGYDDWEYTGETSYDRDNGKLYLFTGRGGQWFDEEDLKDFEFFSDEFEELRAYQFECKRLGQGQAFTNALKRHDEKIESQELAELKADYAALSAGFELFNEREYRSRFLEEWREEKQKEIDANGESSIAGFPDADLIYKRYFEQKEYIAVLERALELACEDELGEDEVVVDYEAYKNSFIEQAKKEIAEEEDKAHE